MAEKAQIDYNHVTVYDITPDNQVGTDADHLISYPGKSYNRVVPTPTGDIAYVRKFGTDYLIKQVTDITDPVDANMTFTVKAADGTTLGSRVGGGAFAAGSTLTTAQACYMEIAASGGAVTVLAAITIDTDVDVGGLAFTCAAETVADATTLTLYLSDTGSTYYDILYMYGGARHTPVLDNTRKPYFDIATAYGALAAANNDGVEILDSETYDEDLTTDNQALDSSDTIIYASSGQNPTITRGVGARVTREVSTQYNNLTAIYFNKVNGNDANAGTWQSPKLTIAGAYSAISGHSVVYGGTGATVTATLTGGISCTVTTTFETDYGYIPEIIFTTTSCFYSGGTVPIINIDGFKINGNISSGGAIDLGRSNYIRNLTICNCYGGIKYDPNVTTTIIENCVTYNNTEYGIQINNISRTFSGTIKNCINYNTGKGIRIQIQTFSGTIKNCINYNNDYGIYIHYYTDIFSGDIENCTNYNNNYGIRTDIQVTFSGTIKNCINYNNSIYDLYKFGGVAVTITESNWLTNSGFTDGAGNIHTDPEFCKTTLSYMLGISSNSGAYRTDTSSDDMGAHFRIIEIDAADIIINGINIDGQNQYNNAIFIRDTANHIGLNVKWCNVFDCQGIAIDLYDNDTDLDAIVSNNIIKNSGNGLKLAYGGNTVEENLFIGNTIFAIWSDWTGNTFNHNVFQLNQYGLYFESNSGGLVITNNIFNANSLYGIYSEIAMAITYCCITDSYNSNVDITDASNIIDNPLFVNENVGSEDLKLKRVERGNIVESPCLDVSDSSAFPDIGAYDEVAIILDDSWDKYTIEHSPRNMNEEQLLKGSINFDDVFGNVHSFMESDRILIPFGWESNSMTSETQRLKMRYFQTLIPSRENGKKESECEFRIKLLPTAFYGNGTGTIDATAKTLTDSSASWVENAKKGWWVSIKFASGSATGTLTASTKKLQVSPSPAWTNDEWIGYYFKYNGYYYYITDNDADELTLSDPYSTLADASNIDWEIDKYFKIEKNTTTVLTLTDDDSELVSGSYTYFIDFILCRVMPASFTYSQAVYSYDEVHNNFKSGYAITFQEID